MVEVATPDLKGGCSSLCRVPFGGICNTFPLTLNGITYPSLFISSGIPVHPLWEGEE